MLITKDIRYVGVNDHKVDLFEGQYIVPNGISYNSYAIIDDKIAIMDTVDVNFFEEFLYRIRQAIGYRPIDFLNASGVTDAGLNYTYADDYYKQYDENGNAVVGDDVRLFDCKNCIIHTPDLKKVVIQGLEDCIVSKHGDRLLISRKDHEQQITDYSKD